MPIDLSQINPADVNRMKSEAMTQQFLMTTSVEIYSRLIADAGQLGPDELRKLAVQARNASTFLAEAWGLLKVVEGQEEPVDR